MTVIDFAAYADGHREPDCEHGIHVARCDQPCIGCGDSGPERVPDRKLDVYRGPALKLTYTAPH